MQKSTESKGYKKYRTHNIKQEYLINHLVGLVAPQTIGVRPGKYKFNKPFGWPRGSTDRGVRPLKYNESTILSTDHIK